MRKYYICFLFLIGGIFSGFSQSAQLNYNRTELMEYFKREEFSEAVQYLRSHNNSASLQFNSDLGYALFMNEQLNEAKLIFQLILSMDSTNKDANLYLGQIYSSQKDWDNALEHFKKLTVAYPENYRYWQKAASMYALKNETDSAILYYRSAFGRNPFSGSIAVSITDLLIKKQSYDDATVILQDFLKRDTTNVQVIGKWMDLNFKKSNYDTVIAWGEKLFRDSADVVLPYVNLAYSYLNRSQFPKCIVLCDWLMVKNKGSESVLYCAALAHARLKNYEQSNLLLDECIKLNIQAQGRRYLEAKADNYERLKDYKRSVSYYDSSYYIFHQPLSLYFMGRLYDYFLNDKAKAKKYYSLFKTKRKQPADEEEKKIFAYIREYLKQK